MKLTDTRSPLNRWYGMLCSGKSVVVLCGAFLVSLVGWARPTDNGVVIYSNNDEITVISVLGGIPGNGLAEQPGTLVLMKPSYRKTILVMLEMFVMVK